MLGLKFRESFGKAVYIDKILPNTEAARLKREGKIKEGDEIVMVSATFGDEMWSARGVGKYRLEKSIAVRQGMTISFVVEDKNKEKNMKKLADQQKKENDRMTRLQKQLTQEVEASKGKGYAGGAAPRTVYHRACTFQATSAPTPKASPDHRESPCYLVRRLAGSSASGKESIRARSLFEFRCHRRISEGYFLFGVAAGSTFGSTPRVPLP